MQKLEAAAILTEQNMDEIEFLIGHRFKDKGELMNQKPLEVFSDSTIEFLSDLSRVLLSSTEAQEYPDVINFGFYCRRSNLNQLKRSLGDVYRIGKGILFHITPGNVPVNFAYSFVSGFITGNINIIRVPSKDFSQIKIIINALKTVLSYKTYKTQFSDRIFFIRYNHSSDVTDFFSSFCDVRIIWGGDQTINEIRKSPIQPKSTEITFSDRYSIAIINSVKYLQYDKKRKLAEDFFNDTYLFDQNACTSPQTIYWLGSKESVEDAKEKFWSEMTELLEKKNYEIQPKVAIDKLTTLYSQAISQPLIRFKPSKTNQIFRIANENSHLEIENFRCAGGYFNEIDIITLHEISVMIKRNYQTIGYFGFEQKELLDWFYTSKPNGIDRIVPIGRTMEFSLNWDGYDLIHYLTRKIEIS